MLAGIRETFGKVVVTGIIGLIAFVFIFYGVFSPKSTRGLHEGAVAGTVNGDAISIAEFNRELNRRMEFFKNMGGGKLTDDQLKSFRVREAVFQELVNRKLLVQEAHKEGILASDEEVKEKIQEIPAFLKEGKFDFVTYKKVLESNNYSTGGFEKMVRDDISLQQWDGYFKERVHVSEEELKREFAISHNQRNIKYVLLTPESAKSAVAVDPAEVKKLLADPAKVNIAKMKFERGKDTLYKGQKFEGVQESIARDILAGDKLDEIQKINDKRADQVMSQMTTDASSDKAINSQFSGQEIQVKTTGLVDMQKGYLPGIGDAREVLKDAFASKSPIDGKAGGKPKKYNLAGRVLVALVVDSKVPDFAQLGSERQMLVQQIMNRKTRSLYEAWMKTMSTEAKIEPNASVVSSGE
ncbi:MAG: SurA N-terminal domain-containing protein [Bdellovibrionia bacterium]